MSQKKYLSELVILHLKGKKNIFLKKIKCWVNYIFSPYLIYHISIWSITFQYRVNLVLALIS